MKLRPIANQRGYIVPLGLIFLMNFLVAADSSLWREFLQSGYVAGKGLPDFSYAGYWRGEKTPGSLALKEFKVSDFGAIPNDEGDDREAIQKTIDAASVTGGIVLFDVGRYLVRNKEGAPKEPNFVITASRVVLKGAGRDNGGTELYFQDLCEPPSPEKKWKTPWRISVGTIYSSQIEQEKSYPSCKVTGPSLQGQFKVAVEKATLFSPGEVVQLNFESDRVDRLNSLLKGGPWHQEWKFPANFRELHTVGRVEGDQIFFREPLHMSVTSEWEVRKTDQMIEEVGIEDLCLTGNWVDVFEHHRSAKDDSGWQMIQFSNVKNAWAQRIRLKNVNGGIYTYCSMNISILDVVLEGTPGHTSCGSTRSYGVLLAKINDQAGQFHGPGVSDYSSGTVFYRSQWAPTSCFDSHASRPYVTLYDQCKGGINPGRSGGDWARMPHHLGGFVLWNFVHLKSSMTEIDFWSPNRANRDVCLTFDKPLVVGFQGDPLKVAEKSVDIMEATGETAEPGSLYKAQLLKRLKILPEWFKNVE